MGTETQQETPYGRVPHRLPDTPRVGARALSTCWSGDWSPFLHGNPEGGQPGAGAGGKVGVRRGRRPRGLAALPLEQGTQGMVRAARQRLLTWNRPSF